MKKLIQILSPVAGATFALVGITATPAQAILNEKTTNGVTGFTLDFDTAPDGTDLVNSSSSTNGDGLGAQELDGSSGRSIDIDGDGTNETVSTSDGNVGDIWQDFGVTITTNGSAIGLFNIICDNGTLNASLNSPTCDDPQSSGFDQSDPDLAVTSSEADFSNIIITEENIGNSFPDDKGNGSTITFSFDSSVVQTVILEDIIFADDASGTITLNNGNTEVQSLGFDFLNPTKLENQLNNLTDGLTDENSTISDNPITGFEVKLNQSGGVNAVVFQEYRQVPFEAETSFGVLIAAGYGLYRYYKHKKVASIKQETEE